MAERFPGLSERSLRELLFQLARKPRYSQEVKTYGLKDVEALAKRAATPPTARPAAKTRPESTNVDRGADGEGNKKTEAAASREEGHSAAASRRRVPDLPRGHGLHRDVSRMRASFTRGVSQGLGRRERREAHAAGDPAVLSHVPSDDPRRREDRLRRRRDGRRALRRSTRGGTCASYYRGLVDEVLIDEAGDSETHWTNADSNL